MKKKQALLVLLLPLLIGCSTSKKEQTPTPQPSPSVNPTESEVINEYTITFTYCDGSAPIRIKDKDGSTINMPMGKSLDDKAFAGWSTEYDENLGYGKLSKIISGTTFQINGKNQTLYAAYYEKGTTPTVQPTEPSEEPSSPVVPTEQEDEYAKEQIVPTGVPVEEGSIQGAPILHCFNWSINNINSKLQEIKNSGFKAIQLSPMQPQKDYYSGDWKGQWWKLYQPLGFKVAQSNQNVLGTKSDITNLCTKAKSMGIKVIVDIVSNHLAGGSKTSLNGGVQGYEPEIYNNELIHKLGKNADDSNLQSIVQGNIGDYPDLKTESSTVQQRVLSLLKEYIDCGIDGFRFDAAKHIETPDDGAYASNYWPTILNGATNYAISKGKEAPYCYGEILYSAGSGRKITSYTKYMSVTDKSFGTRILNFVRGNSSNIPTTNYDIGAKGDKVVLWAESHDTYSNDEQETTNVPMKTIQRAYIVQASRKDASSLYLSRPQGNIGSIGSTNYTNKDIVAVNQFKTEMAGESEVMSYDNGCFINNRGNQGAVIVPNNNSNTSIKVKINGLVDGTYTDLTNNKKYTASNGEITVNITNYSSVIINDNYVPGQGGQGSVTPSIKFGSYNKLYGTTQNISVTVKNATAKQYSINGDKQKVLSSSGIIKLPSTLPDGKVKLEVFAKNGDVAISESITLVKSQDLLTKDVVVLGVDTSCSYVCWAWKGSGQGKWLDFTSSSGNIGISLNGNDSFIVVKFSKGTTANSANWSNAISQTVDLKFTSGPQVYDFSELGL